MQVDGIWMPLTHVGSAEGILGGLVGSTLLGYLATTMEPTNGSFLLGHVYGGGLHVWNLDGNIVFVKEMGRSSTCWYEKFQPKRSWYYFYECYVIHFPHGMYILMHGTLVDKEYII